MKVAFIHPSNPLQDSTGATYSANKIIESLRDRGHELTVYCTNPVEDRDELGYEVVNFLEEDSSYRSSTAQLNREIVERKNELSQFDVVYSYPMNTILGLGKISGEIEAKTVVTLNAYGAICPTNTMLYREKHESIGSPKCLKCIAKQQKARFDGGGLNWLKEMPIDTARKILKLNRIRKTRNYVDDIDAYVALTDHVKERYSRAGFPEEKIDVIPPILDEKFLVEHQSDFEQPYKLLYVGYLKNHKGVERLVPLIEKLNKESEKKFELTIVGDGPYRNKIEKQIEKSTEKDKIDFKGLVPNKELPETYSEHDMFIYPGKWEEPFGRIFIESLSAGTPVISTPKGIANNYDAIKTSSSEKLYEAVENASDSSKLERLSEKGIDHTQGFKSSKLSDDIENLLIKLVGEEK